MTTKITTGKVRLSYCHLFKPYAISKEDKAKYSATLLIPKSDKITFQKIQNAMKGAREKYQEKGKKLPTKCKNTLYDGDDVRPNGEEFSPECRGHYVITASSNYQPVLVDKNKEEIIDENEIYSGCYARCVLNFYVYDTRGNKGITAGLNGVMKLKDGEPLGGVSVTDSDWDLEEEEEEEGEEEGEEKEDEEVEDDDDDLLG